MSTPNTTDGRNNNLLGFLQKQSLFSNPTPTTNNAYKKMSSRSREKRSQLWQNPSDTNINSNPNLNSSPPNLKNNATFNAGFNISNTFNAAQNNGNQGFSSQNFTTQNFPTQNFSQPQNLVTGQSSGWQTTIQENNTNAYYQNANQFGSNYQTQQFGQVEFKAESNLPIPTKSNAQNPFQTNPNSFNNQSPTRSVKGNIQNPNGGEALKRLDILAEKVKVQITGLNSKLEAFSAQVMSIVVGEFNFVKNKVYQILEENFKENESYCKSYISKVQVEASQEVLKVRAVLQKESENITMMKNDFNKPHWEANAGFVSVELQARVNQKLAQIKSVEPKMNKLGEMNLKRDLLDRVILRLQRQREMAFGKPI